MGNVVFRFLLGCHGAGWSAWGWGFGVSGEPAPGGLGAFWCQGCFLVVKAEGNEEEALTRLSWDEMCCSRWCFPLLAVLSTLAGHAEASPQAEARVILLTQVKGAACCAFD